MRVQRRGRFEKVEVTADGKGLASHAGAGLLVAVADKVGLTDALSRRSPLPASAARRTIRERWRATCA